MVDVGGSGGGDGGGDGDGDIMMYIMLLLLLLFAYRVISHTRMHCSCQQETNRADDMDVVEFHSLLGVINVKTSVHLSNVLVSGVVVSGFVVVVVVVCC